MWDMRTGAELMTLGLHGDHVSSAAMSGDVFSGGEQCGSVVFSPDGRRVVVGCAKGNIYVLEVQTGARVLGPLRGHTRGITSVVVSPDGTYIYSGS